MANKYDRFLARPVSPIEALMRLRIERFDSSMHESLSPKQRPFFQSLFMLNRATKGERFTEGEIASSIGQVDRPFLQRAIGRYAIALDSRTNSGSRTLVELIPGLSPRNARKVIANELQNNEFFDLKTDRELTNHVKVIKALTAARHLEDRDFIPVLDHMSKACKQSSGGEKDPAPDSDKYLEVAKDLIAKISLDQKTVDEFVGYIDPNTRRGTELIKALADRGFLSPGNLETIVRQSIFFDNPNGLKSFLALQEYNASQSRDERIDLVQVAKDIPDVAMGVGWRMDFDAIDVLVLQRSAGLISYDELEQGLSDPKAICLYRDLIVGYADKNIDERVADELITNGFTSEGDSLLGTPIRARDISNRPGSPTVVRTEQDHQPSTDIKGYGFDR